MYFDNFYFLLFQGLDEYFPREAKEKSRSRVVVDYLEDLSVEMLKKRLEESESRNKNMRQKLEDALVTQKLEIQSLKSELYIKNEVFFILSLHILAELKN